MTQARSGQTLRLQLTPMKILEAASPARIADTSTYSSALRDGVVTDISVTRCEVLLQPGEPSELLVQLQNLGTRSLRLNVQVEGNIPLEWYRIGMEGYELAPGQQMDALLYFQIPANFFEQQDSLGPGQSLLLDYQSRLCVYYTDLVTGRQMVESAPFNLYVRPRSLYLNFVPAIYREVDFIGRMLKIFEQAFEPAVEALNVMWAYLDPMTAPEALLPFLAYWVGWPIDKRWDVPRQRQLIRQAVQLYQWRGTRRGLRYYLHLYTNLPLDDDHIRIEEIFSDGFVIGSTHLGQDSIIGGGRPYHFIVRLRPALGLQVDEQLVRYIIEQEKPAFCTYELYIENQPVAS